ncbi:MAG: hypothetical protein KAU58_07100 [Candidatus Omnitrophica bacterium]|nr:hypothetical protein [Candidatus Omnitrophota bacterium]
MAKKRTTIIILIILLIVLSVVVTFRLLQWKAQTDLELNVKLSNFTDKIDNALNAVTSFLDKAKK